MQTLKLTKKYEKYLEYKDSGVEWLGKIPKDWKVVSSRQLFTTAKERVGTSFADHKILSLTLQGVVPRVLDGSGKNPAEYDTYQKFRKNDLVFCLFDYDVTPRTIGYVEEDGMMTGAYTRLIPGSETYSKYFYYYFLSLDFSKELLHLCTGLRNSLSKPVFWSMKSSLPSISVQERIVKYLDEKTSYIDRIIENKQKLIELLSEKRTAVINNVVTKGLDQKVELVESGVDWIGKVPKGWEIRKLKSGFSFEKGKEAGKFTQEFVTNEKNKGEYPVYSGQTENDGILGKINTHKYNFPEGVLFSTTVGAKAMTTKFLVGKFSLSQNCVLMIPNKKASSAYFNYLLEIGFKRMRDNIPSHMQPSLRVSDLNKFIVLFPTFVEQKSIAEYLDKKTKFFDGAINTANKTIELLQELKSSLISNAVTGKIKV